MSFCPNVWFSLFLIRICTTYKQAAITCSQIPLKLILIYISNMGFVVLMAANIKAAVLHDVKPCGLVTTVSEKRLFKLLATV
jgi:hypothetical protein